ncbi:NAD(P)-binding protein [Aureobasidium namibiae CBS 147.97]|uniref:NAD(P)-binding protein n=1 Tax=Aureobasidium namibiae CBS 147.97 TaxID=1043004 RepID=A0A074WMC3_9PEZI|nr:NAD(P)-binding protein [Aureobasidium namibiae CBS 147.97]KEQ74260.1 NAD(P)-binding protein [Aureobasidium namibiae CBS 147.97]
MSHALSEVLTPTLLTSLTILSIFYPLTLSPTPPTPTLSLDYCLHVLSFLFPPLPYLYSFALSYILSLHAINHPTTVTSALTCFIIAVWYTSLYTLSALNTRLGNGRSRAVVWREQIAVVTGGAGGLGWLMAKLLELRGAEVVVWDVREPDEWAGADEGGVRWMSVDVGDVDAVEKAYKRVCHEVGTPTILINNAGIVNGLPLLSLSASQISRCFHINTLSHFYTCRTFLPSILSSPNGGTIVTVSSVLGHLGASHLTDYTASKAALLAFHTSLRSEIAQLAEHASYPGAHNTKMILVKPGQLSTAMFSTLKSPSEFFGPVVQARDLAREVVDAIEQGGNGVVSMPMYAWLIEWLGVLPILLQRAARWMSGVDGAMRSFGSKRE